MVKLNHLFVPATLDDIVGQPIERLKQSMKYPRQSAWMLVGPPGTGKTITTRIVANMIGCTDEWHGLHHVPCTSFGIDQAKQLFHELRLRSLSGKHLLILEECEWLSAQVQRFLKDALDPATNMPDSLIVFGTSNGIDGLDEALVDRFNVIEFSANEQFAASCHEKIRSIWMRLMNEEPPAEYKRWGYGDSGNFSMRRAIKHAESALQAAMTSSVR